MPPGLPSALLERRPDILYAEQQLVSANAHVGEAKALLFPQISITGPAGRESTALSKLITTPASYWTITHSLTQPVYTGGKLRAGVRRAEAVKEQAVLEYKKAVQQAFQGVSDALVGLRKLHDVRVEVEKQRDALKGQTSLAYQRYYGGLTNYLEVLDSEQQLFSSELNLAQVRSNELVAVVILYQALGGGWQLDEQSVSGEGREKQKADANLTETPETLSVDKGLQVFD